jgi:hypothetical protein
MPSIKQEEPDISASEKQKQQSAELPNSQWEQWKEMEATNSSRGRERPTKRTPDQVHRHLLPKQLPPLAIREHSLAIRSNCIIHGKTAIPPQ